MLIFKQLSRFSREGTSINNILILIRQVKKIFKSDFSLKNLREKRNFFNAEKKRIEAFKRKTREGKKSNQILSFNLGAGVLTFL